MGVQNTVSGGTLPSPKPTYPKYTSNEARAVLNAIDAASKTKSVDIIVQTFLTKRRAQGSPGEFEEDGSLQLGQKEVMGVIMQYAAYRPSTPNAEWCDISSSVRVVNDQSLNAFAVGDVRYVKIMDTLRTNYGFDIKVSSKPKPNSFTGTLSFLDKSFEWIGEPPSEGSQISQKSITVSDVDMDQTDKPAPLEKVTIQRLDELTPIAAIDISAEDITTGDDAAQVRGDTMMRKITMHALGEDTRIALNLTLGGLSGAEKTLLNDNKEYFERVAVHILAEQMLKMDEIDKGLRSHIQYKMYWFTRMMTSLKAPKNATDVDPVVKYGWDRTKNAAELTKLQDQYLKITTYCYEAGYKQTCPDWEQYIKHPIYWFSLYSSFLMCDDHTKYWTAHLPYREDDGMKRNTAAQTEIMHMGNKLILLKHAAPKDKQQDLDVDKVTTYLNSVAQLSLAYSQLLTQNSAKRLDEIVKKMNAEQETDAFKKTFNSLNDSAKEKIHEAKTDMAKTAHGLTSQENELFHAIGQFWNNRVPDGAHPAHSEKTYAQVLESLDEMKQSKAIKEYVDNPNASKWVNMSPEQMERKFGAMWQLEYIDQTMQKDVEAAKPKPTIKDWMAKKATEFKDGAKKPINYWNKAKAGLHMGATILLVSELVNNGHMDWKEVTQISLMLGAEALTLTSKITAKLFAAIYGKWQVCGNIVAWLKNAVVEAGAKFGKRMAVGLVGNLSKFCRTLGIIGSTLGVISSYSKMNEAHNTDEEGQRELMYDRILFWLSTFELVFGVLGVALEIFGYAGASAVCGVLGAVFGAIGIIVLLIYISTYKPDNQKPYREFLQGDAKRYGSWDDTRSTGDDPSSATEMKAIKARL